MFQISKELLEVIFCNRDKEVVVSFNNLMTISMQLGMREINLLTEGNKKAEDELSVNLETFKFIFKYVKNALRLIHK